MVIPVSVTAPSPSKFNVATSSPYLDTPPPCIVIVPLLSIVTLVIPVSVTAPLPSKFNVATSSPNLDTPSPVTITPPALAFIRIASASVLADVIRISVAVPVAVISKSSPASFPPAVISIPPAEVVISRAFAAFVDDDNALADIFPENSVAVTTPEAFTLKLSATIITSSSEVAAAPALIVIPPDPVINWIASAAVPPELFFISIFSDAGVALALSLK